MKGPDEKERRRHLIERLNRDEERLREPEQHGRLSEEELELRLELERNRRPNPGF